MQLTDEEAQQLRVCRSSYSRHAHRPSYRADMPLAVLLCSLGSTVFLMAVTLGLLVFR